MSSDVTELQTCHLFGQDRHPEAQRLENAELVAGTNITAANSFIE